MPKKPKCQFLSPPNSDLTLPSPSPTSPEEDDAGARPPQRLVRGRGDDVAHVERRGRLSGGHEARDVRHVGQQEGAHVVRDPPEPRIVQVTWVARDACGGDEGNR